MPVTKLPVSDSADALQRIDDVLRLARSVVWEIDRDGVFTYVSPSIEDVLGYRPEEVVGIRTIHDFYPPDLTPHGREEAERGWLNEPCEFTNSEVPLLSKSGAIVWVASDGKPVFDEDGSLAGFRGADTDITARKQLEGRLESRERQLFELIAAAPVPMAYTTVSKEGNMHINRAFAQTFGYAADEIPTIEAWFRRAYPDEAYRTEVLRRHDALFSALGTGQKVAPQEYLIARKDGFVLEVEVDAAVVGDCFVGTFVDVTERNRARRSLQESEERLRNVIENTPLPVAYTASGSRVLRLNKTFTASYGWTEEDLPTLDVWFEKIYPDPAYRRSVLETWNADLEHALRTDGKIGTRAYRFAAKDGSVREVEITVELSGGEMFGTFVDRTERHRVEKLLRESESTLRNLVEDAPLGIVRTALSSGRLWVNKTFTQMLGYTAEDVPTLEDWFCRAYPDPAYRSQIKKDWSEAAQRALEGGGRIDDSEVRVIDKSGREHDMQFSGVIIRDEVFGMWTDLTERTRAEALLRERQEQLTRAGRVSTLGQLAASLAHELEQPLAAILRNAETADLLLRGGKRINRAELGAIVSDILADDRRAGAVLDRIRAMVRQQKFEPRALPVDVLLHEAAGLVRPALSTRGVALQIVCETGVTDIEGDAVLLQQVLLNLIMNSAEAIGTRADGLISLRAARPEEETVEIAVSDNGGGVPIEHLGRFFEPFHTTKADGLGMGLPLVKSIVELHGGEILVSNRAGEGLVICLRLRAHPGGKKA